MRSTRRCFILILVAISWSCILGLQRPPPRYSQQFMPETSFTCRNKIVGSYYADAETDCQVFHVCVSVAGTIQDYKFLCPNDTAFDQESQTCADWYDVDCEAATLYYSSDNFDLYRIGSGLESLHYDHIRSDAEPQDHLQRSETSDAIRSSANSVNRLSSSTSYSTNNNNRDILRGSNSGNFYNRNGKEDDYENEKSPKEDVIQDNRKKGGIRKVSRKQSYINSNYSPSTTTTASPTTSKKTYNDNYYNGNIYNQRSTTYVTSTTTTTTARPQENYNKNQNTQKYNIQSSTYRPSPTYQTYSSYQPSSTTAKINVYNTNSNYNSQTNVGSFVSSTTLKPSSYNPKIYPAYSQYATQSTTYEPNTNYQTNDYNNYQQRNYNNIQRGISNNIPYQSTTAAPTNYDNNNYSNNNVQYNRASSTTQQDIPQTTAKYFNYANGNYAPTTYSPITKKYLNGGSTVGQTALKNNDNGQYFDKTSQTIKSSTQYHDSTKPAKKATQYNNYDSTNGAKSYYVETSTGSLDIQRQSIGIGFSPASINHLAETPRATTPAPRRPSSATTYNSNNFISTVQKTSQPSTTPRGNTYVSGSARPFTPTTRFSSSSTTERPSKSSKTTKKNDYDYAYYDNTGVLEYDGVDLEHVTSNKESTKIARN